MPYSVVRDGRVDDICFRKVGDADVYQVSLGKESIGQVHKLRSGWVAIANEPLMGPSRLRMMGGFKTRWKAMEYVLVIKGIDETASI
jgi:hypothetical protein